MPIALVGSLKFHKPERRAREDDTADSGMEEAQVTEIVTAVYQEQLDGMQPYWYTCSNVGKGAAV